jgi:hypothetical protein
MLSFGASYGQVFPRTLKPRCAAPGLLIFPIKAGMEIAGLLA